MAKKVPMYTRRLLKRMRRRKELELQVDKEGPLPTRQEQRTARKVDEALRGCADASF